MRNLYLAALVAALPIQAQAATIYTGTLNPVDGFAYLSSIGEPNPSWYMPSGSSMLISFSINQGVIAEAEAFANVSATYQYRVEGYPDTLFANTDFIAAEGCSFNTSSADGCYANGPAPYPSSFIKNLKVDQRSLSYELYRPASFDNCDRGIIGGNCSLEWFVDSSYSFTAFSRKPVSYTLTFGDPIRSAVPEPASWAMMIAGFGLLGSAIRKQRTKFYTVLT